MFPRHSFALKNGPLLQHSLFLLLLCPLAGSLEVLLEEDSWKRRMDKEARTSKDKKEMRGKEDFGTKKMERKIFLKKEKNSRQTCNLIIFKKKKIFWSFNTDRKILSSLLPSRDDETLDKCCGLIWSQFIFLFSISNSLQTLAGLVVAALRGSQQREREREREERGEREREKKSVSFSFNLLPGAICRHTKHMAYQELIAKKGVAAKEKTYVDKVCVCVHMT